MTYKMDWRQIKAAGIYFSVVFRSEKLRVYVILTHYVKVANLLFV